MAKIEYTALVSRIAGRLSHGILSRNKAAAIITRHSAGGHLHRTVKQQLARGTFSDLKGQWYALSPTQKLLWRSFASSSGGAGSGLNAFVEHNIRLLYSGHADLVRISAPPPTPSTPRSVKEIQAWPGLTANTITWTGPLSASDYVQVFCAVLVASAATSRAKYTLLQTVRSDVGHVFHTHSYPSDLTILYRLRSIDAYGRISPWTHAKPEAAIGTQYDTFLYDTAYYN